MTKHWTISCFVLIGIVIVSVCAAPMYYKRNDNDTYEPDLVAVSSTVIPLTVYEVNAALLPAGGLQVTDEYKRAYLKHLHKKVKSADVENPDTLITLNKKYQAAVKTV